MKKIGILCASDTELAPFLDRIRVHSTSEGAMLKFYEGDLGQVPVIALYSGVCKVNAAIAAQLLLDRFQVDGIINGGTAGGMAEKIRVLDTVIADRMIYHDVADDILTEFHPWLMENAFHADCRGASSHDRRQSRNRSLRLHAGGYAPLSAAVCQSGGQLPC